jgi:hypothetical protein
MNLSGECVRSVADFYKIPAENVIVVFDDISLDVGKLRIRKKGSAGGHNGIKSIIAHLGSEAFPRLKFGVGDKPKGMDLADYVLGNFSKEDEAILREAIVRACDGVVAMVTEEDNSEFVPVAEKQYEISRVLARDKKFEILKSKLAGATIEEIASANGVEVVTFENVKYNDFGVGTVTYEPALVGAIAKTKATGAVSAPVKGSSVAAVFVVDGISTTEEQTAEAEKVRRQSFQETIVPQMAVTALQNMVEIEDLRGKYF